MSDLMTRILIGVVAIGFIYVSLFLTKPDSSSGRLSRKLSIVNAVGWLFDRTSLEQGTSPSILDPNELFWLANLVLIEAFG